MNTQLTAQDTWDSLLCEVDYRGTRRWRDETGRLHRNGAPAVIRYSGTQYWYKHGKYHREDGPAIIWADGYIEYWIDDIYFTEEEFNDWKKSNVRK